MPYPYEQRQNELVRISKIPYDGVQEKALEKFVADEKQLLSASSQGLFRSQALSCAERKLEALEKQNNQPQQISSVARVLFP